MTTPLRLQCDCGKTLRVPATMGGKRVKCPSCGARVLASGDPARADSAVAAAGAAADRAATRRKTPWLVAGGVGVLLLAVGLVWLLGRGQRAKVPDDDQVVAPAPAPLKKAGTPATEPPQEKLEFVFQRDRMPPVRCVAMSSDGRFLVTACDQHLAFLWDTATGEKLQSFTGIVQYPQHGSVAVSDDGKFVAATDHLSAIVWDVRSGDEVRRIKHSAPFVKLALSADGKRLVTCVERSVATMWDVSSGQKLREFTDGTAEAPAFHTSLALSPDGTRLVTAGGNPPTLWDAVSGKKLQTFEGQAGAAQVALSADARYVVTVAGGFSALVWDAASGKRLQTLSGHALVGLSDRITSVAVSADGLRVVTGSTDNTAILWEGGPPRAGTQPTLVTIDPNKPFMLKSGNSLGRFAHARYVLGVAISADGRRVVTGSEDGTAVLWDAVSGTKIRTLQARCHPVLRAVLASDGKHLAVGSEDKTALVWNLAAGTAPKVLRGHLGGIRSIAINDDGSRVVTGSDDKTAILWDAATGKNLKTFAEAGPLGVPAVALRRDGTLVATCGSWGAAINLWNANTGEKMRTLQGHKAELRSLAFSADGSRLASGSTIHDARVLLWDVAGGNVVQSFDGHKNDVVDLVLGSTGKHLASVGSADCTAILWEVDGGKKIREFTGHGDFVTCVALDAGATRLVTGSADKTAVLWSAADGTKLQTFLGHEGGVRSVMLSLDGKHVITGSLDDSTRIWDAATGQERCRLYNLAGGQDWLVVTPDGRFDGSRGAWGLLAYRVPGARTLLRDEATRRRFHRPGLLATIWQGSS